MTFSPIFEPQNANPNNLRVVKTGRTLEVINAAVKEGFRPLVKPVVQNPDVLCQISIYQHQVTGKIKYGGDWRWPPKPPYKRVLTQSYYPYYYSEPFGAYLVPKDLKEGERVWLEDIIEDIVAEWGSQGDNPRLMAWEATWAGGDFTVNFNPETDAPRAIG